MPDSRVRCNFCTDGNGEFPAGHAAVLHVSLRGTSAHATAPMMCRKCLRSKYPSMTERQFAAFVQRQRAALEHEGQRKKEAGRALKPEGQVRAGQLAMDDWMKEEAEDA